ncbi:MAG: F0F1 ATP synthase subunit gamma [Gammaproteobacteria bacterium]|nr:F0F1 ATP synthase subunit gamma [Gammaproteobacteria bacterium]
MTQRRELEQRVAGLGEIAEIMRSMKNLAYMETRRLSRLLANQQALVEQLERVAADFLVWHPHIAPATDGGRVVWLAVGSRRGFCGDFNERLRTRLLAEFDPTAGDTAVIAVGHKLCARLGDDLELAAALEGADVAEEIPPVMSAVVAALAALEEVHGPASLKVLWQDPDDPQPRVRQLLPPFLGPPDDPPPSYALAPLINLPPGDLLLGLTEQYLFAALHALLYASLLAENDRRMRHLDAAGRYLDDRAGDLQRRLRSLRQEEMIEEIEVILLNAVGREQAT